MGTLEIQNFKSIKHVKLRSRRVNILIGEPNTGKSNILEAIGLLSHVCHGPISGFVNFESMTDLFYDHILGASISVECNSRTLKVEFKDGIFTGHFHSPHSQTPSQLIFQYSYQGGIAQTPIMSVPWKALAAFKFYRFAKRLNFPNQRSEFLNPSDGDNLLQVIITRKELRKIISELFGKFGYRIVFRPEVGRIEVQKESEDIIVSFPYSLASETLQRVAFYLSAIYSNHDSIITFEEPEAHAFPYYTKYLAERIALDKNNNQYFIATHNPYFLLSILEKTPKNEVATFLTYIEDYETRVSTLNEKEKQEILQMGTDVFFNIEKFLSRRK
jgi:hypothetical protein